MAFFLVKADPERYSFENLERNKNDTWDWVDNHQAWRVIQSMRPGDNVLFYHTTTSRSEPVIVGLACVTSEPRQESGKWVFDIAFERHLSHPVSLREIKESHLFDNWALVRQARLSTMNVPDEFIGWLKERGAL